jgi:hypothetical protein
MDSQVPDARLCELDEVCTKDADANELPHGSLYFNDEAINRFIAIYERKFNEPLKRDEATVMARRLVNMYRLFLRPLPPEVLEGTAEAPDSSSAPMS